MRTWTTVVGVVAMTVLGMGWRSEAAVICKKKSGAMLFRDSACKARELPVDLTAFVVGPKGDKGDQGGVGPAGPLPDMLPSGKTLTGMFGGGADTATAAESAISFAFPLASSPQAHVIAPGDVIPSQCPGTLTSPAAIPGHFCIFIGYTLNTVAYAVYNPYDGSGGVGANFRRGGVVFANPASAGFYEFAGTWAVTAP